MSLVNTMFRAATRFFAMGAVIAALAACSGGGGGGDAPPATGGGDPVTPTTTTISGKVTVPSKVAAAKPGYAAKLMANQPHGKPGSKAYMASRKAALPAGVQLPMGGYEKAFDLGYVWLYDADHPEWLYPVAEGKVNFGSYTLSQTANSVFNGNAYADGQPIPAGKYTLYAFDPVESGIIALKVIVSDYAGDVVGVDLVAEPSDVAPVVQTILGAKKNIDGTATWGSATNDSAAANFIKIRENGAVQIAFSTAMNRVSIKENITIKTATGTVVDGTWQVSPDWKTAVFKPAAGAIAAGNYVVTAQGKDTFPSSYVKNVYGNALAKTATGYFTVLAGTDTASPNAVISLYLNGAYLTSAAKDSVDVVTAIRLKSDELLDVGMLVLSGTPSLGAKPTASYIGKDPLDTSYPYVYEFTLGTPLTVSTTYSVTVTGGKDLSGNAMNSPTYSFTTAAATAVSGVSTTVDTATQTTQAQVKDVFGKWVRAMSDRNMAQLQGLMTGGFVYEYDASQYINDDDINRDSRLSLNEFSAMLEKAFMGWERCGTTITGDVTADIIVSGAQAGMEFTLSATSTGTSPECAQMAPKDKMYAVLEQVNGAWYVSRAAEGLDIRNKALVLRDVITLTSPVEGSTLTANAATGKTNPPTFEWQAVPGVASYLLLIGDDKGQGGVAVVVPATTTKVAFTDGTLAGTSLTNIADVSFLFAGDNNSMMSPTACVPSSTNPCPIYTLDLLREGATYKWEVMGLGTNTFDSFKNGTYKSVFTDIKAISSLNTYKNAGVYLELTWSVVDPTTNTALAYNEWYWAYDAGNAGTVTLNVTSPVSGTLNVGVSGSGYSSQTVTMTAGQAAAISLNLYQGMNSVWMDFNDSTPTTPGSTYLYDGFSITTTGGIPPAVSITSVVDNTGVTYSKCGTAPCIDQWSYLNGTAANTVTISGKVDLVQVPGASTVGVSNWNSSGAYDYKEVSVSSTGNFTVTMDVYNGDNWFNFNAHDANWTAWGYSYLGINTTAGSTWVAPIAVSLPVSPDVVTLSIDYGGSQDWDASNDPDNQITITGTLKSPNQSYTAQFYVSSTGSWQSGNLMVSGNSFTLPVTLYNGWNYVSIDDGSGHWYGVNIYTSTGAVPLRPVIQSVAGLPFDITVTNSVTVDASATGCSVTLTGTLGDTAGNVLNANWYGYDGVTSYYEQSSTTSGAGGAFSVTLPVVGTAAGALGSSYNYLDLYDSQWNWAGVVAYETSGCVYTPPVNSVTAIAVNNGDVATLTANGYGGYSASLATGAATTATVSGINSKANRAISGYSYSCGTSQQLQATADGAGNWSLGQFNLYNGYNSINIYDGYNSTYVDVNTSNGTTPPAPITLTGSSPAATPGTWSDCYGASYNVDMAGGTTLTVSGTLNLTKGMDGSYNIGGTSGTFTTDPTTGAFTISVPVINGYNYLYLYDGNWSSYYLSLYVTNGYTPPPALKIDSPLHNASLPVGATTVTGHVDTNQWTTVPTYIQAWTYDANAGAYTDYSSDPYMQTTYGYQPLTWDAVTGTFSFNANISGTANYTEVYVYGYDASTGYGHGNDIYVNNVNNWSEYSWKPGTRPSAANVAKAAIGGERKLKRMGANQAKARDSKRILRR